MWISAVLAPLAFLYLPIHASAFHVRDVFSEPGVSVLPCSSTQLHASPSKNVLMTPTLCFRNRRDLLVDGGKSLASILVATGPFDNKAWAEGGVARTIVMTGATSGIGFEASKRLASDGHTLIVTGRSLQKAQDAVTRIRDEAPSAKLVPAACDLASLASIQHFVEREAPSTVDTLCLNAGIARNTAATDCSRTADGFELTVGTNHFGHAYLTHLLRNRLARRAHIVVTASGVHDPASPGGAQGVPAGLGTMQGLEVKGKGCEMIDGSVFNADKAYKDSKLCNVLYTRELQRRLEANKDTQDITVNCFNPGLIVGTGLFRYQNQLFTKAFDVAATGVFKVGENPAWGGGCLAYMNSIETKGGYYSSPPGSSKYGDDAYGNQFTLIKPSEEASDDSKATRLWELTAQELGINA